MRETEFYSSDWYMAPTHTDSITVHTHVHVYTEAAVIMWLAVA